MLPTEYERRRFLRGITASAIALPWLLDRDGLLAGEASDDVEMAKPELNPVYDLTPKPAMFAPRATAIHRWANFAD